MKRSLVLIALVLGALILVSLAFSYAYSRKPSVRYLLSMSGFRNPTSWEKSEFSLEIGQETIPVFLYSSPGARSAKYFYLQHGFTPEGYAHPQLHRMAASLTDATGMSVVVPHLWRGARETANHTKMIDLTARVYSALYERLHGSFRAFGACMGGSALLIALNRVPRDIYPEKIFLVGPFQDGKKLIEYYNSASPEVDILVKLAISLNSENLTAQEKELVSRAIQLSKPGPTDRSEMRKILGTKLFNDLSVLTFNSNEVEEMNAEKMFAGGVPKCRYFIMHSLNDTIVPYYEGKGLNEYLKKAGADTAFLGTELFSHTENTITVKGFIREARYLIKFFDELFEGDIEN
ncbi:MAG: hypothetical protein EPN93_07425 [Spirochaetes bacterium]|nr:MAG: hypothetical protein EPN93_07425 [Spirochaetota bacterium]